MSVAVALKVYLSLPVIVPVPWNWAVEPVIVSESMVLLSKLIILRKLMWWNPRFPVGFSCLSYFTVKLNKENPLGKLLCESGVNNPSPMA